MEPITNSTIKEGIRQQNEKAVQYEIGMLYKNYEQGKYKQAFQIGTVVFAFIVAIMGGKFWGFVIGIGIGYAVYFIRDSSRKAAVDTKAHDLLRAYEEKTRQQIKNYEDTVKQYSDSILKKSSDFKVMVDHSVSMFQRMISHADNRPHIQFIQATFVYTVRKTGIYYTYAQSYYSNPQDDFDFNIGKAGVRYRTLDNDAQCEGLARALSKMIIKEMKSKYPPHSTDIKLSHNDACVTLQFKTPNPNFINATSIV